MSIKSRLRSKEYVAKINAITPEWVTEQLKEQARQKLLEAQELEAKALEESKKLPKLKLVEEKSPPTILNVPADNNLSILGVNG